MNEPRERLSLFPVSENTFYFHVIQSGNLLKQIKHSPDLQTHNHNPSALDWISLFFSLLAAVWKNMSQITKRHQTRQKIDGICQYCLVMGSIYDNFIQTNSPAPTAVLLPAPLCIHVQVSPSSSPCLFRNLTKVNLTAVSMEVEIISVCLNLLKKSIQALCDFSKK